MNLQLSTDSLAGDVIQHSKMTSAWSVCSMQASQYSVDVMRGQLQCVFLVY